MLDWKKYAGNFGLPDLNSTLLTSCIGEIIGFDRTLSDEEISYIHEYLMRKWGITDTIV